MTDEFKSTFAKRVRAAKPRARKYDVWDDVISGLGLRVGTSGNRSFFVRRSVRGRIRSATIASADTLTVPEARREARRLLATFPHRPRARGRVVRRCQQGPARASSRSAKPRVRTSRRCPACATRMPACFPAMPKAGGRTALKTAGGRSAKTPASANCACTTSAIPPRVMPSCRAKACCWSGSCSGTGATARRQATRTWPTRILSRPRRRWGNSLPVPWTSTRRRLTHAHLGAMCRILLQTLYYAQTPCSLRVTADD